LTVQLALAATPRLCADKGLIRKDGSILFAQVRFSDLKRLKASLIDYKHRNPNCWMSFSLEPGADPRLADRVLPLLEQAGFATVGFLTEPRNPPPD
jgi:hypothetical protein